MSAKPPPTIAVLVSNSFDKDPRARKVAVSLMQLGLAVTVFAWDRDGDGSARDDPDGMTILRVGPRARAGRGLRQLPAMLMFWLRAIAFLLRGNYRAVHCNRFDTLVPALLARLVRRRPIVYDLHMSYADRLRIHDGQPLMRMLRRLVRTLESYALRNAVAHAFTDAPAYAQYLRARDARSVSPLLNVPLLAFGTPPILRRARANHVVFGRIGAFAEQLGQGAEDLFYVFGRLREEQPDVDIRLQLVGNFVPAGYAASVRRRAASFPGQITIQDYVPHSRVKEWYQRLDLAVIRYDVADSACYSRFSSPQKLFECMAYAIPVVIVANTYAEQLVREVGCGVVPARRDYESIYDACLALIRNPSLREAMGRAGQQAYLQRYHWEHEEKELWRVYQTLELDYERAGGSAGQPAQSRRRRAHRNGAPSAARRAQGAVLEAELVRRLVSEPGAESCHDEARPVR